MVMGSVVAILIGLAIESCNSEERVGAAKNAADVTALDRETTAHQPGRPKPPTKPTPMTRPGDQRRPPTKRVVARRNSKPAKRSARPAVAKPRRCAPAKAKRASVDVDATATANANAKRALAKTETKLAKGKPALAKKAAKRAAGAPSWVPEPVRPPLRLDTHRRHGISPGMGSGLR
jgi:hypothetical protein